MQFGLMWKKRLDTTWHNVQYFLDRFSSVKSLEFVHVDTLYEEFVDYQTSNESELEEGFEKAKVTDGIVNEKDVFHFRMDVVWWYLANLNTPRTSVKRFHNLAKIAEIVLVIPHSNAEPKRLFSIVRKNKSDSRSKLALGGSLSSILTVKSHYPESATPCYKFKTDAELLKNAKHAATNYNKMHQKN